MAVDPDLIAKAEFADQLLSNPTFELVLSDLCAEWMEGWASEQDPEERNRLWHGLQGVIQFKEQLGAYKSRLDHEARKQERKK